MSPDAPNFPALWLVLVASVALVRAEAPRLAWTVPSPVAAGESMHVGKDKPAMQWLDFEAKVMGEPSEPLKNNFWHVSISPGGLCAALVDSESKLLFFTLP